MNTSAFLESFLDKWETQARKGWLEFVILLSLGDREQYGFELIADLKARTAIEVPEGSIYPVMIRLAKDELVSSDWRVGEGGGEGGTPRKYYAVTPRGAEATAAMLDRWDRLARAVAKLTIRRGLRP